MWGVDSFAELGSPEGPSAEDIGINFVYRWLSLSDFFRSFGPSVVPVVTGPNVSASFPGLPQWKTAPLVTLPGDKKEAPAVLKKPEATTGFPDGVSGSARRPHRRRMGSFAARLSILDRKRRNAIWGEVNPT